MIENGLVQIILVEDREDDVLLIRKAMKQAGLLNDVVVLKDGEEVIPFLRACLHEYAHCPVVLLDINLPKKNGIEVLREIKSDVSLRRVPVVMLTCSKRDEDVVRSYDLGCNSFIQKPLQFEEFVQAVKNIGLYWGLLNVHASLR